MMCGVYSKGRKSWNGKSLTEVRSCVVVVVVVVVVGLLKACYPFPRPSESSRLSMLYNVGGI